MKPLLSAVAVASMGISLAQVEPVRIYNGINKPLEAEVRTPLSGEASRLLLLEAGTAREVASAEAARGRVDLGKAFPVLLDAKSARVRYVQLEVGGRRTGPALVLQPMVNPTISRLKPDGKTVEFVPDEDQAFAGYRAWVDKNLVFETTMGRIEFRIRVEAAPNTAWNILDLVRGGFYRDIPWHRIVAKRADGTPFVIQAGDPTGTGNGGPGFAYALEDSTLPHDFGVISVARSTDPNTNGSQIFVCLSREGTKHLDHRYAAFGEAIRGGDVILRLGAVKVGPQDRPVEMPYIRSARLVDAAPYGTGPRPVQRPK